ncbi:MULTISPECIES: NUDIX domain-containing protein [Deinococcus]|uniref:NUDIX hydrolase n=1 Tax=Deinococcus geothermalis (strain DSM 11300 / CIP 105573 / AG-3a) TaxID=319795 RepID=Q1J271_DEIGD|nr:MULTISPECIES: NUDIX domain-containing protein [Deinococcus]ABF44413.1 NUDIX hydrolase [Deinococcus geothermalis DSM 11300]MBI0446126.1 NUDIX domain-containing protein [Deinococcus sp. DB0503]
MNRPVVCVGALVWGPDGQVLLVRTTKWRGLWGVPGGKVDWGETLAEAVQREFREETGLTLRDIRYAQTQEAVLSEEFHKPAHMVLVDFFARTDTTAITPNEEIEAWVWVPLAEAAGYPLNTVTRMLVELAQTWEEA